MRRRHVLVLASTATTSIAGCLESRTPTGSDGHSRSMGETAEADDGTTVTVRDVTVRRLIPSTSVGSATHVDVACLPGRQFAVVDADATGPDGSADVDDVRLALEVDGTRYPRPDEHWYWANIGPDERPGVPAYPAPIAEASEAAVVWSRPDGDPARWPLADATVETLARAPSFEVTALRAPDSMRRDDSIEAEFTVANRGERDGRFVAEFGAGPLSDHPERTVAVPTEAERTVSERFSPHTTEDTDEIAVTLDWGCGRRVRRVTVTG